MTATSAATYRRISDDREGRELGVARQAHDLAALAAQRGYTTVADYLDNDVGASTRSAKPRLGYSRMLADARAGRFSVILAYSSSRLTRRPREREDLIELAEQHGVRIEYVRSPSVDLNSADGRHVARMMAAADTAESERIAERVAATNLALARSGVLKRGGRRPYGYERDGVTVRPSEAAEIVRAADAILAGVSLAQATRDLRVRDVASVTGARWSTRSLRDILLRPRNAGLVVHRGAVLPDVVAPGEPILQRDVWEAVRARLTDPARRTSPGNTPRWLGSGLYLCGHAECAARDPLAVLTVGTTGATRHGRRSPSYGCRRKRHVTRQAAALDAFVRAVIVARLARPDAVGLLTPPAHGPDPAALARDAEAVRGKRAELRRLWRDDVVSEAEFRIERADLDQRLAAIEERQLAVAGRDPLAGVAGQADAAAVWDGLDLGRQRAILAALLVVVVLPQAPGRRPDGSRFDPEAVRVEWAV